MDAYLVSTTVLAPEAPNIQHPSDHDPDNDLSCPRLFSVQSLFALPGNQPFVFVEGGRTPGDADPLLAQVRLLQKLCLAGETADTRGCSSLFRLVGALPF